MGTTNDRGKFITWAAQPSGYRFTGQFKGLDRGRFGLLATFDTDEGVVTTPAPRVLEASLAGIAPGTTLLIEYRGLQTSQRNPGRHYHGFKVVPIEPDAAAPPTPVAVDADVPF